MQITSKDANKLLKQFEEELGSLKANESYAKTWIASTCENKEDVRPEYDYVATQKTINDLNSKIRTVKHAINVFNVNTVVPGFDKTIDEMLVYIPQLSAQKLKLMNMKDCPKFERKYNRSSSNIIDYSYINYDAKEVTRDYLIVSEELTKAQMALDKINLTKTLEIKL